ncbi:MAG: hypothetical protein MJ237_05975 [bacterium]|nr:hypothetical protein [bacterium]
MNMSYCRFHNTYGDFCDCLDAIQDCEELSESEEEYAERLYNAAKEYVTAYEERKEYM